MTLARRDRGSLVFSLALVAVYTVALVLRGTLLTTTGGTAVAAGLVLDLTVVLPTLFYFLVLKPRNGSWLLVVPAFFASLAAAATIVPRGLQGSLRQVELLAIPLELGAMVWIGLRAAAALRAFRQAGGTADALRALRRAGREVAGAHLVTDVFAFELSVLYYSLASWRQEPPPPAEERFTLHRRSGYGLLVGGILIAMAAELVPVHLLVHRFWSPAAAWVVSALSAYGALWLIGDWRAAKLRPLELFDDRLELRVGLRWDVTVPRARVRSLRRLSPTVPKDPVALRATVHGPGVFELELEEPVVAEGPYGRRRMAHRVRFQVDEPERFEARWSASVV